MRQVLFNQRYLTTAVSFGFRIQYRLFNQKDRFRANTETIRSGRFLPRQSYGSLWRPFLARYRTHCSTQSVWIMS